MNSASTSSPPGDDVVDRVAVLVDGGPLQSLRRERDKVRQATQGSYGALFDPTLQGLTVADRLLVALSASRLTPVPALAAHYRERLERQQVDAGGVDPAALHAADGSGPVEAVAARLQALLVFARTLVERPIEGDR
ncbi:MAG TPA: acyltransferase, partial [Caldimonas sp.]|nr:acyltransferase [Caldimonas sp.]